MMQRSASRDTSCKSDSEGSSSSSQIEGQSKSKRRSKKVSRSQKKNGGVTRQANMFESSLMEYRSPSLGKQLTDALSDDSLSDVTFMVGPERKMVRGLRIVIAARNAFLKKMLYDDAREQDGNLKRQFDLPSTHAVSFELMMRFMHSGGLSWEPHQTVQLLEVSIDFQVDEIMKKCMELVAESMTDNLSLLELTKLIQILLRGDGFDVNLQHPKTGTSALHIASREGGVDLVSDLLARGAKLQWTDVNGATALHLARTAEIAELLVAQAGPEACFMLDKGGNPPLVYAICNKRDDVRAFLMDHGAGAHFFKHAHMEMDICQTALNKGHDAPVTEIKMVNTVEGLIKMVEKEAELYPKIIAPPNLIDVCRAGSAWGTRSALARKEDVNQRDDREAAKLLLPGYTALHWAAAMGHLGCVQMLLASDEIDLNPTDTEMDDGYTPLQLCINYKQRDWDKVKSLMMARGARLRPPTQSEYDEELEQQEDILKSQCPSISISTL